MKMATPRVSDRIPDTPTTLQAAPMMYLEFDPQMDPSVLREHDAPLLAEADVQATFRSISTAVDTSLLSWQRRQLQAPWLTPSGTHTPAVPVPVAPHGCDAAVRPATARSYAPALTSVGGSRSAHGGGGVDTAGGGGSVPTDTGAYTVPSRVVRHAQSVTIETLLNWSL